MTELSNGELRGGPGKRAVAIHTPLRNFLSSVAIVRVVWLRLLLESHRRRVIPANPNGLAKSFVWCFSALDTLDMARVTWSCFLISWRYPQPWYFHAVSWRSLYTGCVLATVWCLAVRRINIKYFTLPYTSRTVSPASHHLAWRLLGQCRSKYPQRCYYLNETTFVISMWYVRGGFGRTWSAIAIP